MAGERRLLDPLAEQYWKAYYLMDNYTQQAELSVMLSMARDLESRLRWYQGIAAIAVSMMGLALLWLVLVTVASQNWTLLLRMW